MNKLFRNYLTVFLVSSLAVAASSCGDKEDEPAPVNEEQELITSVSITLEPVEKGHQTVTATWSDPDGEGGANPTISELHLDANTTYHATLGVLDESKTPTEDITEEITEKGYEHEFFFVPSTGLNVTVTKTDADKNGRPIGLESDMITGEASIGTFRIVLKHQPNLKNDTSTINTGESDVDVTFPTTISN